VTGTEKARTSGHSSGPETTYREVIVPKITFGVTAAILAVLALTGCSGPDPTVAPTASAPAASAAAPETMESTPPPLVAESPAADADDEAFLAAVRERQTAFRTQIPNATDEQLLAAGQDACDRLASGESGETMVLIEGEEPNVGGYYLDSSAIITAARLNLCP
jgi:hypothetical protein